MRGKAVFVGTHVSEELNCQLIAIAARRLITKGATIRQALAEFAKEELSA